MTTNERGKSAKEKIMDFLARRNHSELELRQKLSRFDYDESEIDDAIEEARTRKWLADPSITASEIAADLGRKQKSAEFINEYLKAKGLPPVRKNLDEEIAKGRALIVSKMPRLQQHTEGPLGRDEVIKIRRLLSNRGYDSETTRLVLSEFKTENVNEEDIYEEP
jgi:regulatory protein